MKVKFIFDENSRFNEKIKEKDLEIIALNKQQIIYMNKYEKATQDIKKLKEEAENKKMKAEQQEIEIIKKLQTTTKLQQSMTDELKKMNIKSIMNGDYENYNISNQNNFKGKIEKVKEIVESDVESEYDENGNKLPKKKIN